MIRSRHPFVDSSLLHMDSQEIDYLRLFKTRIRYYVPIFKWLPKYDYHKDFVHDFVAGVTVAMLLIPQSLSYAINLAKLEPVYGLYSCFIPLIIYGILGTSRYTILKHLR